jgi:hypothetical protein
MTTTREIKGRERRVAQLARGEQNIRERLVSLRDEVDLLGAMLNRITLPRQPRLHAGTGLDLLDNLLPFPRRRLRGKP